MGTTCYQDDAQDSRVAAEALAAAGVIRARHGAIDNPETQLADILRQSDRRSLLWRFPIDQSNAVENGFRAEELAAIWREQTELLLAGGGCRLRAWDPDLSTEEYIDATDRLLTPLVELHAAGYVFDWRDVPSSVIASVALLVPGMGWRHNWRWPLRLVATGTDAVHPELQPFTRGLARLGTPEKFQFSSDLWIQSYEPGEQVRVSPSAPGFTVQLTSATGLVGRLNTALGLRSVLEQSILDPLRPEALLAASEEALPRFLTSLVYALSHDAPPDVALFDAWLRLSSRPETPPVLLAPSFGFDDDMEQARLSTQVALATTSLGRQVTRSRLLGAPQVITVSPGLAHAFSLTQAGEIPIADLHAQLVGNILAGRVRFDNESDTGENLGDLMSEIDRLGIQVGVEGFGSPQITGSPPVSMAIELGDDSAAELARSAPAADTEPSVFEDEAFEIARAKSAPAPELFAKTDRYVDPVLYHGYYAVGDVPDLTDMVPDDEALNEDSEYTLEIAIRSKPIGIDRTSDSPPTLVPARNAEKTVTVYVRVESLDESLLSFEDGFLPIEWPFDSDSESAFFRCQTHRGPRGRNTMDIEVLIYSAELHLLDVLTIRDIVIGDDLNALIRSKHFPEDRPTALTPAAGEQSVDLSLRIKSVPLGYTAEAIFGVGPQKLRPIPLGHAIPTDDIRALLVRVRDFWTELVVGDLSVKDRLRAHKYRQCLDEIWRLGGAAWRLFFGNDRDGSGAALGNLIRALDLPPDSLIQITCREDARHFAFPWALMRPDPHLGGEPVPEALWGLRYVVEQTTRKGSRNLRLSDAPVRIASVIDPGFAGLVEHRATLEAAIAGGGWDASNILSTQDELQASLSGPQPAQMYYFFCHGFTPGENTRLAADSIRLLREKARGSDNQAAWDTLLNRLQVVPGEAKMFFGTASLTETELNEINFFQGRSRPIVFLNMCHSADLLPAMGHGLTRRFIERNASAVLGTECPMTAVFADLFAGKVLERLANYQPVGQAVLETRRHFHAEHNPLGFAYTLYGRSDARLGPDPSPTLIRS